MPPMKLLPAFTRGLEPDGALRVKRIRSIKIVRAGDVQNVRLRLAGEM